MANKFQHKRSVISGVVPTTIQTSNGEIAINLADGVIYTNNGSAVIMIGHGIAGSNTQLQFNDSGFVNASAGLVFNKSTNTITIGDTTISGSDGLYVNTSASAALTIGNSTVNVVSNSTVWKVGSNTVANTSAYKANNLFLTANSCDSATTITTTGTSAQNLDSFLISTYRSGRYFYSAKDNAANNYQTGEFMMIYDGGAATLTEYGTITTNSALIALSVTSNSTAAIVQVTPTSANTTIQLRKTLLSI